MTQPQTQALLGSTLELAQRSVEIVSVAAEGLGQLARAAPESVVPRASRRRPRARSRPGTLRSTDLAERLRVSEATILRRLRELAAERRVRREGAGKSTRYARAAS